MADGIDTAALLELIGSEPRMTDARRQALRNQQQLGMLLGGSSVGGGNVGQMGRQMQAQATKQLEPKPDETLDNLYKVMQIQKAQHDMQNPKSRWQYKFDPVTGESFWVNPDTMQVMPGGSQPGGAPGAGGALPQATGQPGGMEPPPAGVPTSGIGSGQGGTRPRLRAKAGEDEKRTAFNVESMMGSIDTIQNAIAKNPEAQLPGFWENIARSQEWDSLANILSNEDRQIVEAEWSNIIDKALWLATGAAYNTEQLSAILRARKPAWGDKPGTLKAKMDGMISDLKAAASRAGRAWTDDMDMTLNTVLRQMYRQPVQEVDPASLQMPAGQPMQGGNILPSRSSVLPQATGQGDIIDLPPR